MVRIDIKPLSINAAWRGRRFKTKEHVKYRNDLAFLLPSTFKLPKAPYHIFFEFGFSHKSSDWDNPVKLIQDALSDKYGFNDRLVRKGTVVTKIVPKGQEYFKFDIKHIETEGY